MKLADLTWKEIARRLESERRLIVPAGTCEQHGPHLPLSSDTLVAERVAEYLSRKTGILVAPTIHYGVNLPCDRGYAGTCSLSPELLRGTVGSILEWWKGQGFARFFLLSAHGDPLHIEALRAADPDAVRVLSLYDFPMRDILERQEGGRHACEAETSVMLFLRPKAVRREEIRDFTLPFEEFRPYLLHEKTGPIDSAPGHQGFPSFASAAKGKRLYGMMKRRALAWLERGGLE